jgi:hypothetical protein
MRSARQTANTAEEAKLKIVRQLIRKKYYESNFAPRRLLYKHAKS